MGRDEWLHNEKHERLFPFQLLCAYLHAFLLYKNHAVVLIHDSLVRMRESES